MKKSKDKSIPYYERRPADLKAVRKKQLENMLYKVSSLPNEEWREVFDTKIYFVSNLGRVKCLSRRVANKHGTISYKREKLLGFGGSKKYPMVTLFINGEKQYHLLHRLVAIHFIPNPENKAEVNHIKGTAFGHSVINLEWATKSENQIHAYRTGLTKHFEGENSPRCKLSDIQIRTIRRLCTEGYFTRREIAKMYNISCPYISLLINKKNRVNA